MFGTDIPNYLDWFARAMKCHFDMFHRRIAALVDADGSMASLHELWTDQYDLMALEVNGLAPLVRTLQRDANRFFAIRIGKALDAEYQRWGSDTGTMQVFFSFFPQSSANSQTDPKIYEFLQHNATHMYQSSLEGIRHQIFGLLHSVEHRLGGIVQTAVQQTARDHHRCIIKPLLHRASTHELQLKREATWAARAGDRQLDLAAALMEGSLEEDEDEEDQVHEQEARRGQQQPATITLALERIPEDEGEQ